MTLSSILKHCNMKPILKCSNLLQQNTATPLDIHAKICLLTANETFTATFLKLLTHWHLSYQVKELATHLLCDSCVTGRSLCSPLLHLLCVLLG